MSEHKRKDSGSVASTTKTEGFRLREELTAIKAEQCSKGGHEGFFLSRSHLNKLESRLHSLMESGNTSASPTLLIQMQNELNTMVSRAEKAEAALKAAKAEARANFQNLAEVTDAYEKQKQASAGALASVNAEKSAILLQLLEAEKLQKGAAKVVSDPEVVAERAKLITKLQQQLAELNAIYNSEKSKTNALKAQITHLENEAKLLAAKKARFQGATIKNDEPLEKLDPLVFEEAMAGATLKKVFSDQSLKLLQEAANAKRNNLREYAFKLMEVASRTDPKNFVGYREYSKVIFDKVKSTTARKRSQYIPVLDALFDSLAKKTGPKLKEVKAEFSELFTVNGGKSEKTQEKVKSGNYTWWDAIKFDFRLYKLELKLRWSIWTKKRLSFLSALSSKVSGWFFRK